jgi:thioester reductase-like protein
MNTKHNTAHIANDPLSAAWVSRLRADVRTYALSHLPKPMVPTHFVVLPDLPELPNGKVDRANLPALQQQVDAGADHVAARSELEGQIARIWEEVLGVKNVGVERSFFTIGGDSLTLLQVASRIAEVCQVRLDLASALEQPTVAHFSRLVAAAAPSPVGARAKGAPRQAAPALARASPAAPAVNVRGISPEEMLLEATLPDDVVPQPNVWPAAHGNFRTILVTSGTGYTGAFLLRELLDRSTATLCVLARAEDSVAAAARVLANLEAYGLRQLGDADRIEGVAGDLAKPYLGLEREIYQDLAERVELIFHNAADTRLTETFAQLKPVNILGSVEVLRLACRARIKPVHYFCSIAVYPRRAGESVEREAELMETEDISGGYRQTEWVADKLMHQARARGVPAYVYRLGVVTGSSKNGVCTTRTFFNNMIKSSIQLGAAMIYDIPLEMVPVDYASAAVAHIALRSSVSPSTFNLTSARSASLNEVFDMIVAYGYPLDRLEYEEWYERLLAAVDRGEENQMARYLPLLGKGSPADEIGYPGSKPTFDNTNLRRALEGSGIECPDVMLEVFRRYLDYFVSAGFLQTPEEVAKAHARHEAAERDGGSAGSGSAGVEVIHAQ